MGPLIEHASLRALTPQPRALRMHHEPNEPRKPSRLRAALALLLPARQRKGACC